MRIMLVFAGLLACTPGVSEDCAAKVAAARELPVGLIRGLVWYPGEPLAPGVYAMTIEVDNAALDQLLGVPEDPFGPCQPDAFVQDLEFTVVDEPSPSAPVVPPPSFEIETRWHDTSFRSLACCAGTEPFEAIGGDCERTIYGLDCTYLYDYDYLTVQSETFPSTDEYKGLWLYQLVSEHARTSRRSTSAPARSSRPQLCARRSSSRSGRPRTRHRTSRRARCLRAARTTAGTPRTARRTTA